MTKEEFIAKIKVHESKFDELWMGIVQDTNQFIQDNPDVTMYSLQTVDKLVDYLCLSGAWIHDRIQGKSSVPTTPKYRGSLSKKIRKALGYNI
jgi:hypothetical protein